MRKALGNHVVCMTSRCTRCQQAIDLAHLPWEVPCSPTMPLPLLPCTSPPTPVLALCKVHLYSSPSRALVLGPGTRARLEGAHSLASLLPAVLSSLIAAVCGGHCAQPEA